MITDLRRVGRKVREAGPAYTGALLLYRLLPARHAAMCRLVVMTVPTDRQLAEARPLEPGEIVRWAGPGDVDALDAMGQSRALVEARWARGHRASVLEVDGELIGYTWYGRRIIEEEDLHLRLVAGEDQCVAFDGRVVAERRGRGHFGRLMRQTLARVGDEGVTGVLIVIDRLNRKSIGAHVGMGAKIETTLDIAHVGSHTVVWDEARRRLMYAAGGEYVVLEAGADF